jgi:ComF family protein
MRASQVYTWVDRCAGWLWPPRCVLCRGPGQLPAYDLCADCEDELPAISEGCAHCGLPRTGTPSTDGTAGCDHCRALDLPYSRCLAPWAYEFPVTQLVQALKYEGALAHARVLGTRIANAAAPALAALPCHDAPPLIVPMPLHPSRLVERGFNQSREIARVVARRLDLRLAESALRRTRATVPQVGLARHERAGNLRGAFAAESQDVAGRAVILLDDVVTTGSTAAEAARALLAAQAISVQVWAAARAVQR